MNRKENRKMLPVSFVFRIVQGTLIGPGVVLPGGFGALVTVILPVKVINALFDNYYSIAFHGIVVGVVLALALDKFNSGVKVE